MTVISEVKIVVIRELSISGKSGQIVAVISKLSNELISMKNIDVICKLSIRVAYVIL